MKKWVLLTVFLKSSVFFFSETTIFTVFAEKHRSCITKSCYVEKNRKFKKNIGLFLNMAKRCFLDLFFFRL